MYWVGACTHRNVPRERVTVPQQYVTFVVHVRLVGRAIPLNPQYIAREERRVVVDCDPMSRTDVWPSFLQGRPALVDL